MVLVSQKHNPQICAILLKFFRKNTTTLVNFLNFDQGEAIVFHPIIMLMCICTTLLLVEMLAGINTTSGGAKFIRKTLKNLFSFVETDVRSSGEKNKKSGVDATAV